MASASDADTKARSERPRDAATLVLIDQSTDEPRVLMGRRRADQIFLPNKFVFPGGRVERADARAPSITELKPTDVAKLQLDVRGEASPNRPRALALAAIRETYEETGVLVGERHPGDPTASTGPWQDFLAHGVVPSLAHLTFFARAITPPGRARRYDTRFFFADASAVAHRIDVTDGELSGINWFSLDEVRSLDVPGITRAVIEDLSDRVLGGFPGPANAPVPFYFYRDGKFERVLLSQDYKGAE